LRETKKRKMNYQTKNNQTPHRKSADRKVYAEIPDVVVGDSLWRVSGRYFCIDDDDQEMSLESITENFTDEEAQALATSLGKPATYIADFRDFLKAASKVQLKATSGWTGDWEEKE